MVSGILNLRRVRGKKLDSVDWQPSEQLVVNSGNTVVPHGKNRTTAKDPPICAGLLDTLWRIDMSIESGWIAERFQPRQ